MPDLGVISGVAGTVIAAAALWLSRRDKGSDKLDVLAARVGRLETQMEPFWAAVQADMIKLLHHPWPERAGMDALLDKLDAGTITPGERGDLRVLLGQVINATEEDPGPFPVSTAERAIAVFLLHSMDLVNVAGGELRKVTSAEPEEPGAALVRTVTTLVARVERALRVYRYVLIALALVTAGLCGGAYGLYQQQRAQHGAAVATCRAGNSFRAADEGNWDTFLAIALGAHPKPEAVRVAAQIRARIHQADQPRDCTKV